MYDIINSALQSLVDHVNSVTGVLPDLCPFSKSFEDIQSSVFSEYLGYVNYFLPVSEIVTIGFTWSMLISAYYLVSIALRWAKAIS